MGELSLVQYELLNKFYKVLIIKQLHCTFYEVRLLQQKVGLGGSCHWCTEAMFQALKGVHLVEQGWIASCAPHTAFSEAVVVHFNEAIISLEDLVRVHLHTHSCTANHSMRAKYRSAVYCFNQQQIQQVTDGV